MLPCGVRPSGRVCRAWLASSDSEVHDRHNNIQRHSLAQFFLFLGGMVSSSELPCVPCGLPVALSRKRPAVAFSCFSVSMHFATLRPASIDALAANGDHGSNHRIIARCRSAMQQSVGTLHPPLRLQRANGVGNLARLVMVDCQ